MFDARDGGVGVAFCGAVFVEGDVGLASTEDDAVDFRGGGDGFGMFWIGDYPLEVGVAGEIFHGRAGKGVAEKRF